MNLRSSAQQEFSEGSLHTILHTCLRHFPSAENQQFTSASIPPMFAKILSWTPASENRVKRLVLLVRGVQEDNVRAVLQRLQPLRAHDAAHRQGRRDPLGEDVALVDRLLDVQHPLGEGEFTGV